MLCTNGINHCPACGSGKISYNAGSYSPAGVIVRCSSCGVAYEIMVAAKEQDDGE